MRLSPAIGLYFGERGREIHVAAYSKLRLNELSIDYTRDDQGLY